MIIIVLGVFVGLILVFFTAPIIIIQGRSKLKEMQRLVKEFRERNFNSEKDRDRARGDLLSKLAALKSGISISDKASTERARDLMTMAASL